MDFNLDTSWCPVCDRQILPKRYLVPIAPPTPPPPPSSPQSSPTKTSNETTVRRNKNGGTIRARGGLVHGTGRVKPNGQVKRSDSSSKTAPQPLPATAKPALPLKHRTVIDQGPIPLYCSDQCQMADIHNMYGAISLDYDPNRLPPVSHNAFASPTPTGNSETESDSTSSSSMDSQSYFTTSSLKSTPMSPSIATLAAIYNFPPLPPPPPVFDDNTSSSDSEYPPQYTSGVMMANRRIEAALCPKPTKRSAYGQPAPVPPQPRKPIPGWTDGSDEWRSSVYSFSQPKDLSFNDPLRREESTKAYRSFVASSHRSGGVYSTLGDRTAIPHKVGSAPSLPSARALETQELYSKYSQCLSRRSESRASLNSPPSSSFPANTRRRERSLLKPGAEGKLLVPNVKMRVHGGSSASLSSNGSWSDSSNGTILARQTPRSPLTPRGSASENGDVATSLITTKRPAVETRSWSYDNLKTYPVMQLPPKIEKRMEKRVIDGEEIEVEVEVEVVQPLKRLFNFPVKERR